MAENTPATTAKPLTSFDPNETLRKLTQNIQEYKAPSNWAYDPAYENVTNSISRNIAALQASNAQKMQRLGEDYEVATQRAGDVNQQNQSSLQHKLANQGIGYSGVNISEQGRLGKQYTESLDALNRGATRAQEDIGMSTAQQVADWQNLMGQAQSERAARQAEREKEAAAQAAQAQAAKEAADAQRQWMADLQAKLTQQTQPQVQPTGQMAVPKASVQKAIAAIPRPAVQKTPQQQVQSLNVDPKVLQTYLRNAGFDPGPIDGIIGKKSQLALTRWKQSVGLPANADINQDIWSRLIKTLPNAARSGPVDWSSQKTFDLLGI